MTSPPPNSLASSEHSSEIGETARTEAAQALSDLQSQSSAPEESQSVPLPVSSAGDTPLSSAAPSGELHLRPFPTPSRITLPEIRRGPTVVIPVNNGPHPQELPSRSVKRSASSELQAPEGRHNSGPYQPAQPSHIPTSSTGARSTAVPLRFVPTRVSHRHQAPSSAGAYTPAHTRDPQAGKRPTGRPPKNPPYLANPARITSGHGEDEEEDVPVFASAPHARASVNLQAHLHFHNTFRVPVPEELRHAVSPLELPSAGPSTSPTYREPPGPSSSNSLFPVAPSSFSPTRESHDFPSFAGPRSANPRPPLSPTRPSTSYTLPSPGTPIPPPQSQIRNPPNPLAIEQASVQGSVEVDGYLIIRNAIPPLLVREVVSMIDRGLPVNGRSESVHTYVTPVQAYRVRDTFAMNWRHTLHPFYDPMRKTIPHMPIASVVGSFVASDPTDLRQSLLHTGNKDEIYVHIALTTLWPENGFYNILRGSHQTRHPSLTRVDDWNRNPITLQEGDALVWRGDLSYLPSPNGGGIWQSLTFEWGPGLIDLTRD